MDPHGLHDLLADEAYDLPMPPGALDVVRRRSARIRRRRQALLAIPVVAVAVGLAPLLAGGGDTSSLRYGGSPTPSPTPPPLPYQPPSAAVRMVCIAHDTQGVVDPGAGVLDARIVTGDPVADCARIGYEQGYEVPLKAYYDGHVYLTVVPASWDMPSTYRVLPAGFRPDARRVAANLMLEDRVDGPVVGGTGRCLTDAQATTRTREILGQVGLNYDVRKLEDTPVADGRQACAYALFPQEASTTVLIGAHDNVSVGSTAGPFYVFRNELRTRIAERCVDLEEARNAVREAASITGFREDTDYRLLTTTVGGDRCTRVDLLAGGKLQAVVLRNS